MAEHDEAVKTADFNQTLALIRHPGGGGRRLAIWGLLESCQNYLKTIAERNAEPALLQVVGPSDLVNEALLDAHGHIDEFRGRTEGQFRRWLGSILRTRMSRARRRLHGGTVSLPDPSHGRFDPALVARNTPPSEFARRNEDADGLRRILAEMPEHYRRVLVLHFVELRTEQDIAREMGISQAAAHGYILRAVRQLRAKLAQRR